MNSEFQIYKSDRKHKKYVAVLNDGRKIHFGDSRYQQYKDTTALGIYSHLDHGDDRRRSLYYSRHGRVAKKYTPKWFSHRFLW